MNIIPDHKLMRIDKQKQETMDLYHSKYFYIPTMKSALCILELVIIKIYKIVIL